MGIRATTLSFSTEHVYWTLVYVSEKSPPGSIIYVFFFLIDVVMCLYEYNNSSWKFSSQRIYIFCDIRVVVSVAVENFCTQYEAKINTHTTLLNISALNVIPDCQVTLIHITPPDITNLIYWHNGVFKIHCT